MGLDVAKLRKLVALDANDPLSRFALGNKLFETDPSPESLAEAADHLRFANARAPEHLATYHVLGQVLIRLGRRDEARRVRKPASSGWRGSARGWAATWGRRCGNYCFAPRRATADVGTGTAHLGPACRRAPCGAGYRVCLSVHFAPADRFYEVPRRVLGDGARGEQHHHWFACEFRDTGGRPAVHASGRCRYLVVRGPRVRRRKRTRLVWKVQLVIASLLCIASTVGAVFEVEGFPVYLWWNYGRARDWADVVFFGVAWFIAVEAAAWVDRRVTRYGLPCPAPAEPE